MTFEQQYQQLNQQQKRVVDGLDQNILLLAAAGTGKTNTLALRIANILRQGLAEGNQILCLTFTNRACKEMKERISSMESAKDITVRTFHSFCFEVVRGYAKQSDISTDLMISDEDDCLDLLKELDLSAMGCDNLQPQTKGYLRQVYQGISPYPHCIRPKLPFYPTVVKRLL